MKNHDKMDGFFENLHNAIKHSISDLRKIYPDKSIFCDAISSNYESVYESYTGEGVSFEESNSEIDASKDSSEENAIYKFTKEFLSQKGSLSKYREKLHTRNTFEVTSSQDVAAACRLIRRSEKREDIDFQKPNPSTRSSKYHKLIYGDRSSEVRKNVFNDKQKRISEIYGVEDCERIREVIEKLNARGIELEIIADLVMRAFEGGDEYIRDYNESVRGDIADLNHLFFINQVLPIA